MDIDEIDGTYFDLQAYWGATKHMGGLVSTKELIKHCHIEDKYVLDVGCGVGATSCHLAKTLGCNVVGIDISPHMIERAKERMIRLGLEGKVTFMVGDVSKMKFKNNTFDVVLSESVLTFVKDKAKALAEMRRVLDKGGYLGINEEIWLDRPPAEIKDYISNAWEVKVNLPESWKDNLKKTKLKVKYHKEYSFSGLKQVSGMFRYDMADIFHTFTRGILLVFNSAFWDYTKRVKNVPPELMKYLGYGIYTARK